VQADQVRGFLQVGAYDESGRASGPLATDAGGLDIQQAFVELKPRTGSRPGIRLGRQEMTLGSSRFVASREGLNIRRSFDGLRLLYPSTNVDIDAFAMRPVSNRPDAFDDRADDHQAFWGVYAVIRRRTGPSIDLYYLGLERDQAVFASRSGHEARHSIGARLWGRKERFDYNLEGAYQLGSLEDLDIRAFALSADIGWSLETLPLRPRLGLKGNIESGDRKTSDQELNTFNPLFPNHAYFSEATFGAPMNGIDLQPNLTLHLAENLSLTTGVDAFWRASRQDAVYNAALQPFPIAPGGDRFVGAMFVAHLRWRLGRHIELNTEYAAFRVGDAIHAAGGKNSDFLMVSAAYRF
jgi:hypothetical protein